jgi:SAM-dependent methyltransferase
MVIEIASNDGYLLQNFVEAGIPCLGIEPAANVARVARDKGIETIVQFFGDWLAADLAGAGRQADLILANNVLAHAPRLNDFLSGLKRLLKPDGRIVIEFPYGMDFLEQNEFDTVYHEHVFYFCLTPLVAALERHGLSIFRVERIPVHGGSLRLFVSHAEKYVVETSVRELLDEETLKSARETAVQEKFAANAIRLKDELLECLAELKQAGKTVAAYGASAKGSTLLNYLSPPPGTIDFVVDRSHYKHGRLTPGLHLPILPAEQLLARMPDYTLLLTWNFSAEIIAQQKEYHGRGGKFIIPIPAVKIV